jgi:hypothetical protein
MAARSEANHFGFTNRTPLRSLCLCVSKKLQTPHPDAVRFSLTYAGARPNASSTLKIASKLPDPETNFQFF